MRGRADLPGSFGGGGCSGGPKLRSVGVHHSALGQRDLPGSRDWESSHGHQSGYGGVSGSGSGRTHRGGFLNAGAGCAGEGGHGGGNAIPADDRGAGERTELHRLPARQRRGYFFPTLSGVARSLNFYPIGYERAEEGIAKVAFGLGKAVVDGEQVLRFSPKYPQHVLQTSTPELTMRETQQTMYALNLQPDKFKTSIDDAVNLEKINIADCTKFRNTKHVTSTWDMQSMRLTDSPLAEGIKVVTFARILKYNTFPLADILCRLLEIGQNEMKTCVEIEFAANLDRGKRFSIFNVLQIRPIAAAAAETNMDWNSVDTSNALIYSQSALGTGYVEGVTDVIYLRKENFDPAKTQAMAEEVTRLNSKMRTEGRGYLLAGFGRWGSSNPWLGVPIKWSDISEVKVIVECGLDNFRIEPSQGTHFFQNMTSFGVGYITVNPYAGEGVLDFDRLDAMPALYESDFIRHVRFDSPLEICIDGVKNKALVK